MMLPFRFMRKNAESAFLSACIARVVSENGHSVVYETAVEALSAYEDRKFRPGDDAEERVERLTVAQTTDTSVTLTWNRVVGAAGYRVYQKIDGAWVKAKTLSGAGVKLYEYTPGFVHSKVFVSDDKKAVVGTINLDYRSLYHHFECAAYLFKTPCVADIERDFKDTLEKCRPVTDEDIRKEPFGYRLLGVFMKFFAPLM